MIEEVHNKLLELTEEESKIKLLVRLLLLVIKLPPDIIMLGGNFLCKY